MIKEKIPTNSKSAPANRPKRTSGVAQPTETSLLRLRLKELDREFARQTKQLTQLTKKLGRKLNQPIHLPKKSSKD